VPAMVPQTILILMTLCYCPSKKFRTLFFLVPNLYAQRYDPSCRF
jgi:hypothetical protein